ncbi:MAG TPA: metal ABC transporter permease [Syntrophales bacterium]|jgi:zinc transport system permease protein|nr:metal ABC transporter permease [Syntrophales bacterium]HPX55581.1 metal ABC transporter permease [Syntrophales bacterium]HQA81797.1 metal ABC transporter permease [Syntrophales bacterium]
MIVDILQYEFMQNALLASLLASIVCGLIGPFIVTKRIVSISGGLSHTAFAGLGLAYWLGFNPLYGAALVVIAASLFISHNENRNIDRSDLLIGMLWAAGVAAGILFISLTPGFIPDLMSFLFGNILTVPDSDLRIAFGLFLIVFISVMIFYKGFVAISLDEEYASTRHLPVRGLKTGLMVLIALSIVTLIQVVGIILVIALLTIPVAVASELSMKFRTIMVLSIVVGIVSCASGLTFSYLFEIPSGAAIIMTGILILILLKGSKRLLRFGRKLPG